MKIIQAATKNVLQELAERIASRSAAGDVILLYGDLGAGKTFFSKAFVRSLSLPDEDVPSPTFTLVQTYDGQKKNGENLTVFHFDLYRLKSPEEIYELGMEEALCEGVSLIEWPQKAEKLLPKERLEIHLEAGNTPEQRTVKIIPKGKRYETENLDL